MTGLDGRRVYLDWNATAPLRPEARAAMLEAIDAVGNPSSVHTEGRAARAIVEKARAQVADLVGCVPSEVVFTSGATEAAKMVLDPDGQTILVLTCSGIEHDCIVENAGLFGSSGMTVNADGTVKIGWRNLSDAWEREPLSECVVALTAANNETGVMQFNALEGLSEQAKEKEQVILFSDFAQTCGKIDSVWQWASLDHAAVSGHKFGSPKGVGALVLRTGIEFTATFRGGGQEMGRRSGTENVIGIAGFGAAAEAAQRDLEARVWERVEKLRDDLEEDLASVAPEAIFFGKDAQRLPNTSCFAVPGWKGETQVMQMDLAGFAVSAGSACSSGKVKESRVLRAMGFDEITASSAIRVSMGPVTTEAEVRAFAEAWKEQYRRRKSRAA